MLTALELMPLTQFGQVHATLRNLRGCAGGSKYAGLNGIAEGGQRRASTWVKCWVSFPEEAA